MVEKKRIQPRDILKISWFLSSVLCCAFWELCGGEKNAHTTPRYLEDILVSIFFGSFVVGKKKAHSTHLEDIFLNISWFLSSVLCCAFFGSFVVVNKRIQPRDILKISWFLSSVLRCAFWELCGGKKKAHSTPRYLEDILKISWLLSSVLCCAFWELCGGKKAHSTPRYLENILKISWFLSSVLCFAL